MERLKNYIQICGSKQIKLRETARMISLLTLTNIRQNILKGNITHLTHDVYL